MALVHLTTAGLLALQHHCRDWVSISPRAALADTCLLAQAGARCMTPHICSDITDLHCGRRPKVCGTLETCSRLLCDSTTMCTCHQPHTAHPFTGFISSSRSIRAAPPIGWLAERHTEAEATEGAYRPAQPPARAALSHSGEVGQGAREGFDGRPQQPSLTGPLMSRRWRHRGLRGGRGTIVLLGRVNVGLGPCLGTQSCVT